MSRSHIFFSQKIKILNIYNKRNFKGGLMKRLNSEEFKSIALAVLLMIVGILFCCSLSIGIDGLSVIIGLILMIIGLLLLVNSFAENKGLFVVEGILGIVILSLGILFISSKLAGVIFAYIPWFLIVLGVVIIADALVDKFIKKNDILFRFIVKIVVGALAIILGLCLQLISGFMEYASIILGILMIVYSGYLLYGSLINKKSNNQ